MGYQYVVVRMPFVQPPATEESVWTERLNAVAAEGWRLVAISDKAAKGFTTHFATFEREVPS